MTGDAIGEATEDASTDAAGRAGRDGDGRFDGYRGLFGAFPYAFRRSDSWLFRLYVLFGGALALVLGLAFLVSFAVSIAGSTGLAAGGTTSFVRAFVVLVGFLVVLPLVAPVLFVARRHRRTGSDVRYDRTLAAAGLVFVGSLYFGAIASMPPEFVLDGQAISRPPPSGPLAPIVSVLYAVPAVASPAVPALGAAVVYLAHRRYR